MFIKLCLLTVCLVLLGAFPGGAQDVLPSAPPRLANGALVDGAVVVAQPEGLLIRTPQGEISYPWPYLSPGTRRRYEGPMREELRVQAEAEAKAEERRLAREAAKQAAAAKKAATAKKAKKDAAQENAAENVHDETAAEEAPAPAEAPANP